MAPKAVKRCQLCGSNELLDRLGGEFLDLPPVVSTYLQTNDPPSPIEEAEIIKTRDNLATEVADLDLHIKKLFEELVPLVKTRHRKYTEFQKCDAARSPLRRLPPEILREIFTYLHDPSPSDPRVMSYNLRRPRLQDMPWTVSWVCRSWRSVALDLSLIWKNVRVGGVRQPSMHPRLCTQMERAREQMLSVSFNGGWPSPTLSSLGIIFSASNRWRYLYLDTNFDYLSPVRGSLESLQVLRLNMMGEQFGQNDPLINEGVINGLESLPSLHTLITWPKVCLLAPWLPRVQITHLNLGEGSTTISYTQLRQILNAFPNIKNLNTKAPSSGWSGAFPSLEYKSLESLTIHLERKWKSKEPNYLYKITFPSLRSIRIRQRQESTKAVQCLAQLLKDSKCPLEEVTWWLDDSDPDIGAEPFNFTSAYYLPLLRAIDWESVLDLTITAPWDNDVYDALCSRLSKQAFVIGPTFLFSGLQRLNLIGHGPTDAFKRLKEWRPGLWIGVFRDWEDWKPANIRQTYPPQPPKPVEYDWMKYM